MEAHDRNAVHLPSSYSGWIEHLPLRLTNNLAVFGVIRSIIIIGGKVGFEGSLANDFIVFYRDKF